MRWSGVIIVFAGLLLLWIGAYAFMNGPYMRTSWGPIVLDIEKSPGVFGATAPVVISAHQKLETIAGIVAGSGQVLKWHWRASGHLVVEIVDRGGNVVISKEGFSGTITLEAEPGTGYWTVFRNTGTGDITLTEALSESWSSNTLYPYSSAMIALGAFAIPIGVWVATRSRRRPITQVREIRYCKFCGEQITVDAKFCPKCGKAQE